MNLMILLIGSIFGAIAGGLIERMLEEFLPTTLQKPHIFAISVAAIGFAIASLYINENNKLTGQSTASECNISNKTITLNDEPEPFCLEEGQSQHIRVGDETITVTIREERELVYGGVDFSYPVTIILSSNKIERGVNHVIRPGECIHSHPILLDYLKVDTASLSDTFKQARFEIRLSDEASKDKNLCPSIIR